MPTAEINRPALEAVRLRKCADGVWRLAPTPKPRPVKPARTGPPLACDDARLREFGEAIILNAVEHARRGRIAAEPPAVPPSRDGAALRKRWTVAGREAAAWIEGDGLERCMETFGLAIDPAAIRRGAGQAAPVRDPEYQTSRGRPGRGPRGESRASTADGWFWQQTDRRRPAPAE